MMFSYRRLERRDMEANSWRFPGLPSQSGYFRVEEYAVWLGLDLITYER